MIFEIIITVALSLASFWALWMLGRSMWEARRIRRKIRRRLSDICS